MSEPWAAVLRADGDGVTVRFTAPVRSIRLDATGARSLAAKLLMLAESADTGGCSCLITPHERIERDNCPVHVLAY